MGGIVSEHCLDRQITGSNEELLSPTVILGEFSVYKPKRNISMGKL